MPFDIAYIFEKQRFIKQFHYIHTFNFLNETVRIIHIYINRPRIHRVVSMLILNRLCIAIYLIHIDIESLYEVAYVAYVIFKVCPVDIKDHLPSGYLLRLTSRLDRRKVLRVRRGYRHPLAVKLRGIRSVKRHAHEQLGYKKVALCLGIAVYSERI